MSKQKPKSAFIISSVRNAPLEFQRKLEAYKERLLSEGYFNVHLPHMDTKQDARGYDICMQNSIANVTATEVHIFYDQNSEGSHFDIGVTLVDTYFHQKTVYVMEYMSRNIDAFNTHLQLLFNERFDGYDAWIRKMEAMREQDVLQVSYDPKRIRESHLELGIAFALCMFFPEKRIHVLENKGIVHDDGQYFLLFGKSYGKMIVEWEEEQRNIVA